MGVVVVEGVEGVVGVGVVGVVFLIEGILFYIMMLILKFGVVNNY